MAELADAARQKPESWANADDSLNFWGYLCDDRPDLLKFRCKGSKREQVHAWLLNSGCLQD